MWIHIPERKNKKCVETEVGERNLHKSLRFIFVIAQVFGFFPVQGVLKEQVEAVGFAWRSIRVLSSLVTCFGGMLLTVAQLLHLMATGYDQFEMNGVIFYSCGALSCFLFLLMAREWSGIMVKWKEVDVAMSSYGWPKTLDRHLKFVSAIFLMLEAAEHVLIQTNKLVVAVHCKNSLAEGFEHFTVNMSFPFIFNTISYFPWLGILFQSINTRMAFSWTFLDLLIIPISCALSLRFRQINMRIRHMCDLKVSSKMAWRVLYEDYNRLCGLCYFLDQKLSWIILVSFFNNFYFVIFQVFGSMHLDLATDMEKVYYFLSLTLIIMRIVSVCLYGSWIYEESRQPIYLLASTSHEIYNQEIKRFTERVQYQNAGLTGKKLFRITRNLILKITGAAVTYELVVIQFSRNSRQRQVPSKNSIC